MKINKKEGEAARKKEEKEKHLINIECEHQHKRNKEYLFKRKKIKETDH